jgi:hypothetical protein
MNQFCHGITGEGTQCKRTQSLNPNGFCFQHLGQDPHSGQAQSHQQQQQQQDQKQPKQEISRSDSVPQQHPISVNSSSGNNNNNNNNFSEDSNSDELPRCSAVAKSTGLQCKKHVSIVGETNCPKHGGRQLKTAIVLPACNAISKSTRRPCKNQVSSAGQNFCSTHGGSSPSSPSRMVMTPQFQLVQRQGSATSTHILDTSTPTATIQENDEQTIRAWTEMQARSIQFLMETHPKSGCKCSFLSEPCKGIKIAMWAQSLVHLAQTQAQSTGSPSLFKAKVSDLTRFIPTATVAGQGDLFSDLYLAVAMFGSNIFFLPRFYQHIQSEVANNNKPSVPQPIEREDSGSLNIEEEKSDQNDHF